MDWLQNVFTGRCLWNATLLVAQLAPLSIIVIANEVFVSTNTQSMAYLVALTIHPPLILLEAFGQSLALLWKAPFLRALAPAAR